MTRVAVNPAAPAAVGPGNQGGRSTPTDDGARFEVAIRSRLESGRGSRAGDRVDPADPRSRSIVSARNQRPTLDPVLERPQPSRPSSIKATHGAPPVRQRTAEAAAPVGSTSTQVEGPRVASPGTTPTPDAVAVAGAETPVATPVPEATPAPAATTPASTTPAATTPAATAPAASTAGDSDSATSITSTDSRSAQQPAVDQRGPVVGDDTSVIAAAAQPAASPAEARTAVAATQPPATGAPAQDTPATGQPDSDQAQSGQSGSGQPGQSGSGQPGSGQAGTGVPVLAHGRPAVLAAAMAGSDSVLAADPAAGATGVPLVGTDSAPVPTAPPAAAATQAATPGVALGVVDAGSATAAAAAVALAPTAPTTGTATATPVVPAPVPHPVVPLPAQAQVLSAMSPLLTGPDGTHRVTVHLEPENLGKVRVQLSLSGGEVAVHLIAADAATRETLRQGLPELRAQLEQSGLRTAAMDVQSGAADLFGRTGADGGPAQRGGHGAVPGQRTSTADTVLPTPIPTARSLSHDVALDVRM